MGTWGTDIFSDDLASDVRDDYLQLLEDGLPDDQITNQLLCEFADAVIDSEDGPVFWLALSATQLEFGRLEDRVKQKALQIIEEETDLQRWDEFPEDRLKRRQVLHKLKDQILSKSPSRKEI